MRKKYKHLEILSILFLLIMISTGVIGVGLLLSDTSSLPFIILFFIILFIVFAILTIESADTQAKRRAKGTAIDVDDLILGTTIEILSDAEGHNGHYLAKQSDDLIILLEHDNRLQKDSYVVLKEGKKNVLKKNRAN